MRPEARKLLDDVETFPLLAYHVDVFRLARADDAANKPERRCRSVIASWSIVLLS